jgi:hypothetical protein
VYHKQETDPGFSGYRIYWTTNYGGCSWNSLLCGRGCRINTSCDLCSGTVDVAQNTDVYFYIEDCSNATGISFNGANNTSTCPSNTGTYCDDNTCLGVPFIVNSGTTNKDVAITVFVGKLGYLACL